MGRILANRAAAPPLGRSLRLTGDVTATVEYHGFLMGQTAVLVDNEFAVLEDPKLEARLEFRLPYRDGGIRAAVYARYAPRAELVEFSLWVADVLVYAEEEGRILIGGDAAGLPLPSSGGEVDVAELPLPGSGVEPEPDTLPRPSS